MKSLFLSILFITSLSTLAKSQFGYAASLDSTRGDIHRVKIKDWKELTEERSLNSSSYVKPDGTYVKYFSREAVNYLNSSNQWSPVSTLPNVDENGWHADHQKNPFSVMKDGSFESQGVVFSNLKSINILSGEFNYSLTTLKSDTLIFHNVLPSIDKFYQFRNNGIKYSYVIEEPISINQDLIISEEIILPNDNFEIIWHDGTSQTPGFIEIRDVDKNVLFKIASLYCYDAAGNTVIGNYGIEKISSSHYILKMIVPQSYFSQSGLTFPVVIDPLVTGPTTTWSGGAMPSCFSPAVIRIVF